MRLTEHTLKMLAPHEQYILARHICGGFLSSAAKSLWDEDQSPLCPLCHQADTKHHRLLTCSAMQEVRAKWWPLVADAFDLFPHWIHSPFAVYPDDCDVPALIFGTRRLAEPAADVPPHLIPAKGAILRLFTDGSCRHPTIPIASQAGFSVIQDIPPQDDSAHTSVDFWRVSGQAPPRFHVVSCGVVPGSQCSDRAECCAIKSACQHAVSVGAPATVIYTDSQFAIAEWKRLEDSKPCYYPELARALLACKRRQFSLEKVKAHQDLDALHGEALWKASGNFVADEAAKFAIQSDFEFLLEATDRLADQWRYQRDLHYLYARYVLDVFFEEARLKKAPQDTQAVTAADLDHEPPLDQEQFQDWISVSGPVQDWGVPLPSTDWLLACTWPPWFSNAVWRWCRELRWAPQQEGGRVFKGAAHVELLVNFAVVSGVLPPIGLAEERRGGHHAWPELPRTIRNMTHALVDVVRQLSRLSGVDLWPDRRRKVFALRSIQQYESSSGIQQRPAWLLQEDTFTVLKKVVSTRATAPLENYCRKAAARAYQPADTLVQSYFSMSSSQRNTLGRWLKRLHQRA